MLMRGKKLTAYGKAQQALLFHAGLGYSKNVGGDKGSIFRLGATGGAYGVNLRIHRFKTDEPEVKFRGYIPEWEEYDIPYQLSKPSPMPQPTTRASCRSAPPARSWPVPCTTTPP